MSSLKSSVTRWFEALLEDAKRRVTGKTRAPRLELLASSIVKLGDVVFPRLVHTATTLSQVLNRLQLTMIESMIIASLVFGASALALVIILTLVV